MHGGARDVACHTLGTARITGTRAIRIHPRAPPHTITRHRALAHTITYHQALSHTITRHQAPSHSTTPSGRMASLRCMHAGPERWRGRVHAHEHVARMRARTKAEGEGRHDQQEPLEVKPHHRAYAEERPHHTGRKEADPKDGHVKRSARQPVLSPSRRAAAFTWCGARACILAGSWRVAALTSWAS